MQEVPSILSSKDALRKRLTQEVALKEAAVAARARVFWKKQWEQQALPVTTSTVLTMGRSPLATSNHAPAPPTVAINAVYSPMALDEGWATPSLCGIRRDRLLFLAHSAAAILHGVFAITALLITAQSNDPYLQTWRQQFLFVRNTTTCGRDSLFNETAGEDPITAVMVPAGRIHVGLASAFFFILSCAFSLIWVAALTYDPLGRVLLGLLSNAYAPLRWLEYSASASTQIFILLLISGGRSEVELACVFVLMAVTMSYGWLTEVVSRPDPASGGTLWMGDRSDGSNKFRNYCWRMQAHVIGFVPYITAWTVTMSLYQHTLDDIQNAFGDRVADEVPAYIYSALIATIVTFSSFTVTQVVYQWRPPSRYWETELVFAFLSFTSKALLGGILMANLLNQDNAEDGSAG